MNRSILTGTRSVSASRHGGAVIVVVLSLMAMLTFLGLFFFGFASEQFNTSENFVAMEDLEIDPDLTFNEVLQQTIVGTTNQQSVLDGSSWSLVSSILGPPNSNLQFNLSPYTGRGAAVTFNSSGSGSIDVDYNNDGTADTFIVNFSRTQNGGSYPSTMGDFEPNAGYTYPDVNSFFLGFDGYTFNRFASGGNPPFHRVVVPSYFRPQYFLSYRNANDFAPLYTTGSTATQVLRPHNAHKGWTGSAVGGNRYVTSTVTAQSGDTLRRIKPFPFVVDRHNTTTPTTTRMGIFTNHTLSVTAGRQEYDYEYDNDADGDGVTDSILMDLGLPLINLPRGRQVVPMTFIKWIDGDGLMNLNTSGNFAGLRTYGSPVNYNNLMSPPVAARFGLSNFGRSRGEMNLATALYANPTSTSFLAAADIADVTRQQALACGVPFDVTPSAYIPETALMRHTLMANVEMAALLSGRFPYLNQGSTPTKPLGNVPILGRWGDESLVSTFETYLQTNTAGSSAVTLPSGVPGAGQPNVTDNSDLYTTSYGAYFGQPVDPLGRGGLRSLTLTSRGYPRAMANATLPVRFPYYYGVWPTSAYPSGLHDTVNTTGFVDESSEGFPERASNPDDSLFGPEEMLALQGSTADIQRAGILSRAIGLAPFNLRDNLQADVIRRQFTPESWDRLESAIGRYVVNEYNAWRPSASVDIGGEVFNFVFPPMFQDSSIPTDVNVFTTADPFRNAVRRLMAKRIDDDNTNRVSATDWASRGFLGRRLNVNRLLTNINTTTGSPVYQELRPHPTTPISATAVVFNDGSDEDNARQDRQKLARDIYVLLYLVSNANTSVSPVTTGNAVTGGMAPSRTRTIYDDVTCKRMAQFAVNVVDSLDPDNRMTRFEYDMNLADGWNLDDDAYSTTGDTVTADRGTVVGVELQQLTLSEALFVHCPTGTDKSETEWTDDADRSFAFIELRNATPNQVAVDGGHWKLQIDAIGTTQTYKREVILKNSADPTVAAGGLYTIGTAGDDHNQNAGVPRDSFMKVDISGMAMTGMTRIVPAPGVSDANALNLDLIKDMNTNYAVRREDAASSILGDFFPPAMAKELFEASVDLKLTLWRRQDPVRTAPASATASEEADNSWIQVDEMLVKAGNGFARFDPAGTLLTEVENLKSWERAQPLHRMSAAGLASAGGGERRFELPNAMSPNTGQVCNSVSASNQMSQPTSATPAGVLDDGFTLWQPHFDRDFNSIYDLMMIPVFGPDELTNLLAQGPSATPRVSGFATVASIRQPVLAGGLFLEPDHSSNLGAGSPNVKLNNRWYRLLEFLEVESEDIKALDRWSSANAAGSGTTLGVATGTGSVFRAGDVVTIGGASYGIDSVSGDNLTLDGTATWGMGARVTVVKRKWREPGKVNLNTLRSEAVFAAMLDDPTILRLPVDFSSTFPTDSAMGDRNWFYDLLVSRDGLDPLRNIPIPGSPSATGAPFRSLSSTKYRASTTTPDRSVEQTLLRKGGGTTGSVSPVNLQTVRETSTNQYFPGLGLLEARAFSDTDTSTKPDQIDFAMRHRTTSKIGNHSTNRSHIFCGWIGVQYHEAHQVSGGEVQVGARAEDLPIQRIFVVVDMTRLEEAYDSTSQTFDWRKFVIYRQRLE